MNVYDFDGTIYNGDSTVDFFRYALKKNPALIRFLPRQLAAIVLYKLKRIDKTRLKEHFFCFLRGIDAPRLTESFWDAHQRNIFDWYRKQQQADDVVISASPEFLLRPICKRLGIVHLIASEVDSSTGAFSGENCRGEEKVRRFEREFAAAHIERFYSDSRSDLPLARRAEQAFLVKKGTVNNWSAEGSL